MLLFETWDQIGELLTSELGEDMRFEVRVLGLIVSKVLDHIVPAFHNEQG